MAIFVNTSGPEFLWEENVRAFLRIEAALRQFSSHSGEAIYLIRRPLSIPDDHFVLLWSRGVALVGLYPYGGQIQGGLAGAWRGDRLVSGSDHAEMSFDNPYAELSDSIVELEGLLDVLHIKEKIVNKTENSTAGIGISGNLSADGNTPVFERPFSVSTIAIFTGNVREISFKGSVQMETFSAMTTDDAVARSAIHLPFILRTTNRVTPIYSRNDLEEIADELNRSAQLNESSSEKNKDERMADERIKGVSSPAENRHTYFKLRTSSVWKWLVPAVIAVIAILFFTIKSFNHLRPVSKMDTLQKASPSPPRQSEIVVELPVEAELFISPIAYTTRSELDHALATGAGQRYLPDTIQEVAMDSLSLAKGVFGYFKVGHTWRKGKLLETLDPFDTIIVVQFLDPLP